MINNNHNNNNSFYLYTTSKFIHHNSIISSLFFLFLINSNTVIVFSQESYSQFEDDIVNIVAVGDFYCNDETEETIKNIISVNPELIITTGDHVKDEKSASCWIEMSKPIKEKMKIAIGNHDRDSSKIYKQITRNHNLTSPYYSYDFKNIHFISLSTEHPFEEESKQYEFIKNDLEKASTNQDIDWIIVHNHKPFYSTRNDMEVAEELRNTYHPLFEKYNIDLVISSHNQYYERTYPILYNNEDDQEPVIIDDNSESNYYNTSGIIFLTVGTGGDELQDIIYEEDYYIIQKEEYGFLNLKLENDGKTLVGEFRTGDDDDDILDTFKLKKS
ncbi:MAG TPA: metallophosphoesterase [Nitrososphaeraceae archaeon]|nr:metallophosphoesterase [Nitrososphaeraceae archaeon]